MEFMFIGNPRDGGDAGQARGLRAFGMHFPVNVPVRVEDERIARKLQGNDHFVLCDGGKPLHAGTKLIIPAAEIVVPVAAPAPAPAPAGKRKIVKAPVAAE